MPPDETRNALLRAAIGDLIKWSPPAIKETVGPYNPTVFEDFDARRQEVIRDCQDKLATYGENELAILSDRRADDPTELRRAWSNFHSLASDRAKKAPPWFAGGFGHPDYRADFEHWAKSGRFTMHEILCLSVGVEPESFKPKWLADLSVKDTSKYWEPLKFLMRRRAQLLRQFDPGSNNWKVGALDFANWAERTEFETCPEFIRLIRRYHEKQASPGGPSEGIPKKVDKREIDSIAKLITAMAIDHYGYDPEQEKSPVPKEITDMMATLGLSMSEDTVRKYLKRGARCLPAGWKAG